LRAYDVIDFDVISCFCYCAGLPDWATYRHLGDFKVENATKFKAFAKQAPNWAILKENYAIFGRFSNFYKNWLKTFKL